MGEINVKGYQRLKMEDAHPEGIHNLIEGIVKQAAHDFRQGLKTEAKLHKPSLQRMDAEKFFRSNWFYNLTGLDGAYIVRRMRNER